MKEEKCIATKKNNEIPKIIESLDRNKAGPTLPACGLYLVEVQYPE